MQVFLAALASYPDCFATNPRLSFEEHRASLIEPLSLRVEQAHRDEESS